MGREADAGGRWNRVAGVALAMFALVAYDGLANALDRRGAGSIDAIPMNAAPEPRTLDAD